MFENIKIQVTHNTRAGFCVKHQSELEADIDFTDTGFILFY